ncbi:acetylxylan esterase [Phytohabitans suffuscus]|uniref:Deacetylase n=1 Tax=Phytohabitans suffuscus TaxID=624315 RepID=A0A6F8YP95_9ACTN|nr:acetylxylan esterase [Phytohabitans suffuscus]BCB87708.1 deacetylase [Phytohabitans suffuscus]
MSVGSLPEPPAPPPEPADFEAFWRATREELTKPPLSWRIHQRYDDARLGRRVEELTFDSSTGERAFAWVTYPRGAKVARGMVVSHGYQGRPDGPDEYAPAPEAAKIFPCAPGLPRSLSTTIPPVAREHVLHGIGARDTYVHRFCAADIWRSASVLLERFPGIARLDYHGGSFGGGIGALALPWDDRFHRAHLSLPSFGHHPLRLRQPCTGSGEAVRRLAAREPAVRDVLGYFDAATAATRIRIPAFVSVARRDPAVPPIGQFAVYHALAGPKQLYLLSAGHMPYPAEATERAARDRELAAFFA